MDLTELALMMTGVSVTAKIVGLGIGGIGLVGSRAAALVGHARHGFSVSHWTSDRPATAWFPSGVIGLTMELYLAASFVPPLQIGSSLAPPTPTGTTTFLMSTFAVLEAG
jgi:hypothetical protein